MSETRKHLGFWKTAFFYGFPTGLLIICTMVAGFVAFGIKSDAGSQVVGFALMLAYMSLIFFGLRRFRDVDQGGVIKFGKAFGLGLAMAAFAGLAYVLVWEIYVARTGNEFIVLYTNMLTEKAVAGGMAGAELAEYKTKMAKYVTDYEKPSYRMPVTFIENFSMGFLVALVSALVLHTPKFWARKK